MPGIHPPQPTKLTVFVSAVVVLAGLVLAVSVTLPIASVEWAWWGAAALLASLGLAEACKVEISREVEGTGYTISTATIPQIACSILLPPPLGAVLAGSVMLVDEIRGRSPVARLVFNVASTTLSIGVSALAANRMGISGSGLGDSGWQHVASFALVALCFWLCNALPVGLVIALASGRPIRTAMLESARSAAPTELALTILGGLAAFVWVTNPYWLLVGASPAIISQLALRYVAERNRKAAQLSALDRLGGQLSLGLSVDEVFHAVSSQLRGVRSVEGCFMMLLQPPTYFSHGLADAPRERSMARKLATHVDASGDTICLGDWTQDVQGGDASPARSWIALPLG